VSRARPPVTTPVRMPSPRACGVRGGWLCSHNCLAQGRPRRARRTYRRLQAALRAVARRNLATRVAGVVIRAGDIPNVVCLVHAHRNVRSRGINLGVCVAVVVRCSVGACLRWAVKPSGCVIRPDVPRRCALPGSQRLEVHGRCRTPCRCIPPQYPTSEGRCARAFPWDPTRASSGCKTRRLCDPPDVPRHCASPGPPSREVIRGRRGPPLTRPLLSPLEEQSPSTNPARASSLYGWFCS